MNRLPIITNTLDPRIQKYQAAASASSSYFEKHPTIRTSKPAHSREYPYRRFFKIDTDDYKYSKRLRIPAEPINNKARGGRDVL